MIQIVDVCMKNHLQRPSLYACNIFKNKNVVLKNVYSNSVCCVRK